MSLLEECIEALENATILASKEAEQISLQFQKEFKFNAWGRINWATYTNKTVTNSVSEIPPIFNKRRLILEKEEVYILWDEISLPILKCGLKEALKAIDDVTAVSFDTWIYSPFKHYVIELFHEGEITMGFL